MPHATGGALAALREVDQLAHFSILDLPKSLVLAPVSASAIRYERPPGRKTCGLRRIGMSGPGPRFRRSRHRTAESPFLGVCSRKSHRPRPQPIPTTPPPKRHPYDQWSPDARALDLVGDKWTLLIIRDLAAGPRRFVELQRVLPGISTEQLRSRLNRMVADGLLTRQRYREVPPRVDYELTERSRELMPVIGALARWGYDWTWSPPRAGRGHQRRRRSSASRRA